MINITWKIEALKSIDNIENNLYVVVEASWLCKAEELNKNSYISGTTKFPLPSNSFIEFNQLSEEDVLRWCFEDGVNKEEIENQVKEKLNQSQEAKTIGLPWI
jgi:hypothetical protein